MSWGRRSGEWSDEWAELKKLVDLDRESPGLREQVREANEAISKALAETPESTDQRWISRLAEAVRDLLERPPWVYSAAGSYCYYCLNYFEYGHTHTCAYVWASNLVKPTRTKQEKESH